MLGVRVSAIDMPMAIDEIARWVSRRDRRYVCVTGVHGVMESQHDPELRAIHNAAGLTTPDGMPLVWAGRHAGATIARVYGPDLMLAVLEQSVVHGWSSFFFGGRPGVPELLVERLSARFPGLAVAGTYSPPFRSSVGPEDPETLSLINDAHPDLVWVGLGTPKQERWMAANRPLLEAPVVLGVGAAFDIHAGVLPQAPTWMREHGLEWAFRLAVDPRRLWRRYLTNNPRFVLRILATPPRLVGGSDTDESAHEVETTLSA